MPRRSVIVNDKMQKRYRYVRTAAVGRSFDPEFKPELTPQQMLRLGVFCGKYMTDCRKEFPEELVHARQALAAAAATARSISSASTPASRCRSGAARDGSTRTIRAAGSSGIAATTWAAACRTRTRRQIKRWKAIRRHVRQIEKNCEPGDLICRPRQRQALLHWAYDSRKI